MEIEEYNSLFDKTIEEYHILDTVEQPFNNPYKEKMLAHLLYKKCWIDTVQWHYEDLIRLPDIDPLEALALKRKIDASNQERTDMVEYMDRYFLELYKGVKVQEGARINTESPAWAIDRLSILALKIFHMKKELVRSSASEEHQKKCRQKLAILLVQRTDLTTAISQLLRDIEAGTTQMKVYNQMKMYNDKELNPVLYQKRKEIH